LGHASHSRYKPFDVLHEQRIRRRIICHKKQSSQRNCTPAVRQDRCLSSHAQPSDHLSSCQLSPLTRQAVNGCELVYSCTVSIPSSCLTSDTVTSHQSTAGYNTCKNLGADILEKKFNITATSDTHQHLRREFTSKEQIAEGEFVTSDRYAELLMSSFNFQSFCLHSVCDIVNAV